VFTGSGTEADNLAMLGAARYVRARHVIVSAIEHPAVLAAAARLEADGVRITRVAPDIHGAVDTGEVIDRIGPDTALVSIMMANHETGVVQPVAEIAREARSRGVLVHTDAVQAAGRMPLDVALLGVDLLTLSAHKLYGPMGVGALVVRDGTWLDPVVVGGGQERGLRSGTVSVALAVGFGAAADRAHDALSTTAHTLTAFTRRLEASLHERVPGVRVHGAAVDRVPGITSLSIPGLAAEVLVAALDLEGFAVSAGAACSTGAITPSHVLTAMGVDDAGVRGAIRVSAGRTNTEADADALVEALVTIAARSGEVVR
jgi:cysteine desulfurase